MEQLDHIRNLFKKYMQGLASAEEQKALAEAIEQYNNAELEDVLEPIASATDKDPVFRMEDWEGAIQSILQHPIQKKMEVAKVVRLSSWKKFAAAAVIILLLGTGGYFLFFDSDTKRVTAIENQEQRFKNDIAPGGNKAVLILADGSRIVLDNADNGTLTQQGNTNVIKERDGQLEYSHESGVKSQESEVYYNTLTTPRGGKYQLTLADGSKVWLNAESSIRYPSTFPGKERKVEVTGEVYFEIARSNFPPAEGGKRPFIVSILPSTGTTVREPLGQVTVLGTHFNINAYDNEAAILTTLLEGSVSVSVSADSRLTTHGSRLLSPGQQAHLDRNNNIRITENADLEKTMAWKNELFYFDSTDLPTVMRQLQRWYDVEVDYKAQIPYSFVAKISRDVPISQLLKLLELTELVHFRIDGRKITIMK